MPRMPSVRLGFPAVSTPAQHHLHAPHPPSRLQAGPHEVIQDPSGPLSSSQQQGKWRGGDSSPFTFCLFLRPHLHLEV